MHIPDCWKSHVAAHFYFYYGIDDVKGISIFAYKNFLDANYIFRFVIYTEGL